MAAAAAAAAATAAVAALPPMTATTPTAGRRARRAAGNPYAPGGPETTVTGPVPAAPSGQPPAATAPAVPAPAPSPADPPPRRASKARRAPESSPAATPTAAARATPTATPAATPAGPAEPPRRLPAPAPWDEPVRRAPAADSGQVSTPAAALGPAPAPAPAPASAPSPEPAPSPASASIPGAAEVDAGFPALPRTAPEPSTPPTPARRPRPARATARTTPAEPPPAEATELLVTTGAPPARFGRGTVTAATVAVVALALTVAVVVERWPLGDRPGTDVSLSSGRTAGAAQPAPSATPPAASAPAQPATPPVAAPVRPKLGVFRGTSTSQVRAFEKWSGAKVDYVMDYSARDTWREIADPQYMLDEWEGSGYRPVYAVAMLPLTGSATMQAGARGEYDRHFRELARNLVANGQEDAILRVGWEFNVSVSKWRVDDADTFRAYWRHVVTAMRSVDGQEFEFDWNVNASDTEIDAADYWPGADYVDYVGVDVYDLGWEAGTYPYPDDCDAACRLSRQQAAWDHVYGGERGLAFWSDFAKRHGKPMTLPEWGLWDRDDGHGGGDNPFFVERMHAFITDPANNIAYHGYFDVDTDDGQVHALKTLKSAGAVYRRLFE